MDSYTLDLHIQVRLFDLNFIRISQLLYLCLSINELFLEDRIRTQIPSSGEKKTMSY